MPEGMIPHVFVGTPDGDCAHCPLPQASRFHVPPAAVPQHDPGKRPINVHTKDEGMALAATSAASEEFRETFFLAMAEVATTREFFSTNDAWDLLESRGYRRSGSAQATGTIGPSGCSIGLWQRTAQQAINTSGNLHSSDNGVRIYRSLIRGKDLADVAGAVRQKAAALRDAATKRAEAKAAEERPPMPAEYSERTEWRLLDEEGVASPLLEAHVERARRDLGDGFRIQRRTVIETPWGDA